jgi:hypothetical protein
MTEVDFQGPVLESKILSAIAPDHGQLSLDKRRQVSKGLAKIARSLARVVNFQVISHGFQRVGSIRLTPKSAPRTWMRPH